MKEWWSSIIKWTQQFRWNIDFLSEIMINDEESVMGKPVTNAEEWTEWTCFDYVEVLSIGESEIRGERSRTVPM